MDYIKLYNEMDITKPFEHQKRDCLNRMTDLENESEFISESSTDLTLQFLYDIKCDTFALDKQEKLQYISKAFEYFQPSISKTQSRWHNQIVFKAACYICEFLNQYKKLLLNGTDKPYKSKNRAFAIALALAYLNEKISSDSWCSQNFRVEAIEKMGATNGKDASDRARGIYASGYTPTPDKLDKYKRDFPADYNHGMKLYNEHWK